MYTYLYIHTYTHTHIHTYTHTHIHSYTKKHVHTKNKHNSHNVYTRSLVSGKKVPFTDSNQSEVLVHLDGPTTVVNSFCFLKIFHREKPPLGWFLCCLVSKNPVEETPSWKTTPFFLWGFSSSTLSFFLFSKNWGCFSWGVLFLWRNEVGGFLRSKLRVQDITLFPRRCSSLHLSMGR